MKATRSGRRAEGEDRALGGGVAAELALEGDGAGEDAAVDLGEGDVHRDVAGAEAALALGPGGLGAAGEDELQDRDAGGVERGGGAGGAGGADGEAGGVEDDVGRGRGEEAWRGWRRRCQAPPGRSAWP